MADPGYMDGAYLLVGTFKKERWYAQTIFVIQLSEELGLLITINEITYNYIWACSESTNLQPLHAILPFVWN